MGSSRVRIYDIVSNETNDQSEQQQVWSLTASILQSQFFYGNQMISGDGSIFIGGTRSRRIVYPHEDPQVVVYSINSSNEIPLFLDNGLVEYKNSDGVFVREFFHSEGISISYDGTRFTAGMTMYQWNGFDWDWMNESHGLRVLDWNGTAYVPLGQIIRLSAYPSRIQMDQSGDFFVVAGTKYYYDAEIDRWEPSPLSLPTGILSPNGIRLARSKGEDMVEVFQRNDNVDGSTWDQVAIIPAPEKSENPSNDISDFGKSIDWDEDGKTLIVGAPKLEKIRDPNEPRRQGAVYVFQETGCVLNNDGSANSVSCSFDQVGNIPCHGISCGFQVQISADGQFIFFSRYREETDSYDRGWTILSYSRGSTNTTQTMMGSENQGATIVATSRSRDSFIQESIEYENSVMSMIRTSSSHCCFSSTLSVVLLVVTLCFSRQ